MREPLLHVRQYVFFLVGFDEDHPVGMQPHLCQSRKEEIRSRQTPDDRSLRPRGYSRGEQSCGCAIDGPCPAASKLVQSAVGQPASRQYAIDLRNAEFQASELLHRGALEGADAGSKIRYDVLADSGHRSRILFRSR